MISCLSPAGGQDISKHHVPAYSTQCAPNESGTGYLIENAALGRSMIEPMVYSISISFNVDYRGELRPYH